jgi:hypothetical protein
LICSNIGRRIQELYEPHGTASNLTLLQIVASAGQRSDRRTGEHIHQSPLRPGVCPGPAPRERHLASRLECLLFSADPSSAPGAEREDCKWPNGMAALRRLWVEADVALFRCSRPVAGVWRSTGQPGPPVLAEFWPQPCGRWREPASHRPHPINDRLRTRGLAQPCEHSADRALRTRDGVLSFKISGSIVATSQKQ